MKKARSSKGILPILEQPDAKLGAKSFFFLNVICCLGMRQNCCLILILDSICYIPRKPKSFHPLMMQSKYMLIPMKETILQLYAASGSD